MNTLGLINQKRRHKSEPQLAALIDVLTIIVIFIVTGSVMETSSIQLFDNVQLPKSSSRESLETAPQVSFVNGRVWVQTSENKYDVHQLLNDQDNKELLAKFKSELHSTVVQLLTDKDTPYQEVFNVTQVLRQSGVESVLFIAQGSK